MLYVCKKIENYKKQTTFRFYRMDDLMNTSEENIEQLTQNYQTLVCR